LLYREIVKAACLQIHTKFSQKNENVFKIKISSSEERK
jgi:hypothetical protein